MLAEIKELFEWVEKTLRPSFSSFSFNGSLLQTYSKSPLFARQYIFLKTSFLWTTDCQQTFSGVHLKSVIWKFDWINRKVLWINFITTQRVDGASGHKFTEFFLVESVLEPVLRRGPSSTCPCRDTRYWIGFIVETLRTCWLPPCEGIMVTCIILTPSARRTIFY